MVRLPSIPENPEEYQYIPPSPSPSEAGPSAPRRSTRERRAPERYGYEGYKATQKISRAIEQAFAYAIIVLYEPINYSNAMRSPDAQKWKKAKQEELQVLSSAETWVEV